MDVPGPIIVPELDAFIAVRTGILLIGAFYVTDDTPGAVLFLFKNIRLVPLPAGIKCYERGSVARYFDLRIFKVHNDIRKHPHPNNHF